MKKVFILIFGLFLISPVFAQDCTFKMKQEGNPVVDFTKSYFRSWGCIFKKPETAQILNEASKNLPVKTSSCNHFVVLPNGQVINTFECINNQSTTVDDSMYQKVQQNEINQNTIELQKEQIQYYRKLNQNY